MSQGYELNIRDYWNIFHKRKWIIIVSFFAVLLTTIVYTNLQPPLYRTVAIIKIKPGVGLSELFPRQYRWRPHELSDYAKQVVSLPIIKKAVEESELIAKDAPPEELDNLIRAVASSISAKEIEKTNMIRVNMVSGNPQEAAIVLNKIVEVFKLENIKQKNQQVRNVREFIEEQLERVSVKLKEAEDKLKALTLKGVGGSASYIIGKIAQLESRRADSLTKFTELHPDIIKVDEQISSLKEQLKDLPEEEFELGNLERDVAINERLYNLLREKLQEAQIKESEKIDDVILINPAAAPRYPFSPNKRGNYLIGIVLGIILGVSVGLLFEHLDTSIGRIEDLENATKSSVIGVIPYFAGNGRGIKEGFKKRKIFFARKIEKEKRLEKLQSQFITNQKESSVFIEAFRILGANVQVIFGQGDKIKGKCILITSANSQEGKSIITANLSVVMAQMGYKTILVDTDLRRSLIHKIFGLEKKEGGLTDILTGEIAIESAVRMTTDFLLGSASADDILKNPWIDNLHLITAGTTFPNSSYLLNTEKMDKFLEVLREKYDIIIMDSSPILAVSDTSILVPKTDGVIFVYRAGLTSRIALRRAKSQVESAKGEGSLKGIILNNVTPEVSIDTYYYYQRKYYSEKEDIHKEKNQDV